MQACLQNVLSLPSWYKKGAENFRLESIMSLFLHSISRFLVCEHSRTDFLPQFPHFYRESNVELYGLKRRLNGASRKNFNFFRQTCNKKEKNLFIYNGNIVFLQTAKLSRNNRSFLILYLWKSL